jgi:hypothetical protein
MSLNLTYLLWNFKGPLQFSSSSSPSLLFDLEGENWNLYLYAGFVFALFVCIAFGFIFGAVVFVLSRFLSRKPDFVLNV